MGGEGNVLFIIVGMPGAGKSTVVDHLANRAWPVVYFGGITLSEVDKRGLEKNQQNEKMVREEIRANLGDDAYAKMSLPKIIQHLSRSHVIIDGLYSWSEYKYIYKNIETTKIVIAIGCDRHIRYERLMNRNSRSLDRNNAEKRDFAEIEYIQKGGPIAIADYTILNNGCEERLIEKVNMLVEHILEGEGQ